MAYTRDPRIAKYLSGMLGMSGSVPLDEQEGFSISPEAAIGGFAAISSISSISNGFSQAKAIRAQRKFMGQQLLFEASMADIQSRDAVKRGDIVAGNLQKRTAKMLSAQRAALAAQGQETTEDARDILKETSEAGSQDVLTIRNNAFREAFGYRMQSVQLRSQARMSRIAGKFKEKSEIASGFGKAGTSLVVGAGKAGGYF